MTTRLKKIEFGEITFKDTKQTKKYDEITIHSTSKWVRAINFNNAGKEIKTTTYWFPLARIFEIRQENHIDKPSKEK